MRHHNVNRKFGRERNQRRALRRGLAEALVKQGKIKTTEAKAKELRPYIEKLITRSRIKTLANQRLVIARLGELTARKLIKDIAPRYLDRPGGYTRITKLPPRVKDATKMAIIEFV